jgi:hypothetical protein
MILNKLKNILLAQLYREASELPDPDPKVLAIGMAGSLLIKLYGPAWMGKYILNQNSLEFLRDMGTGPLTEYKLQLKILTLGETLYNLKKADGIENVLLELKNGKIESAIAELESGKLLSQRGLNFKYVTRTFKKGSDFDIHILNNGYEIFCDAKRKMDSTEYSTSSLYNSLHKAKQQLPIELPAIILIKIPNNWGVHESELRNFCSSFVKKTNRPLGIVCWYENWFTMDSMHARGFMKGFEEHNEKSRIINSQILPILSLNPKLDKWKYFEQFANGLL